MYSNCKCLCSLFHSECAIRRRNSYNSYWTKKPQTGTSISRTKAAINLCVECAELIDALSRTMQPTPTLTAHVLPERSLASNVSIYIDPNISIYSLVRK